MGLWWDLFVEDIKLIIALKIDVDCVIIVSKGGLFGMRAQWERENT